MAQDTETDTRERRIRVLPSGRETPQCRARQKLVCDIDPSDIARLQEKLILARMSGGWSTSQLPCFG